MIPEVRARISVHLQPNARRDEAVSYENGILRVKIAAPPVEGKANRRLVEFLSEILDIARSRIAIAKGLASKEKTVVIEGLSPDQVSEKLNNLLNRRE